MNIECTYLKEKLSKTHVFDEQKVNKGKSYSPKR